MTERYREMYKAATDIRPTLDPISVLMLYRVPNQSQLQHYLKEHNESDMNTHRMLCLLEEMHDSINVRDVLLSPDFSMEEMWLRVVMKECHDKYWDEQHKVWNLIM